MDKTDPEMTLGSEGNQILHICNYSDNKTKRLIDRIASCKWLWMKKWLNPNGPAPFFHEEIAV